MAKAKRLNSGAWRTLVYSHTEIVDGKKIRRYESFTADTKSESEFLAAQFAKNKSSITSPQNITLRQAVELYIEKSAITLSPTTIAGYKKISRNYFQELLDMPIKKINNNAVQQSLYNDIQRPSKRYKNTVMSLSPKTILNAYGFLTSVLKSYNPSLVIDLKYPKRINHIKELPEPSVIFDIVKGTEIELPVLLYMWLSFSLSEIRGISKSKSIHNGYITIKQVLVDVENKPLLKEQTKAYCRTRKLRIPEYIQSLIDKTNPDEDMLVTLSGHAIYQRFQRLLVKNGIPHMTLHDLRHINASVMAQLRIPDKYAQERGGWKSDRVMKGVYQHTFSEQRKAVDNLIDGYFEKSLNCAT